MAEEEILPAKEKVKSKPKILVVDDIPANRKIIEKILRQPKSIPCKLDHATNGWEAVQLAKQKNYDLILMDVHMPVMNGIQATLAIRQEAQETQSSRPPVKIIAITGDAAWCRMACLEAGMNECLSKPISPSTLCGLIKQFLSAE